MGGKAWRRVHTLVYVAAVAGCIHYWWLVKKGVKAPMPFTLVLAVLLLATGGVEREEADGAGRSATQLRRQKRGLSKAEATLCAGT